MGVITKECRNCGTPALVTETLTSAPAEPRTTLDGETVKRGTKVHRCLYCDALELAGTSKPSKSAKRKKKSSTSSRGSSTARKRSRSRSSSSGTSSRRSSRPSSAKSAKS